MISKTALRKGLTIVRLSGIIVIGVIQTHCANESVPQGGKQDEVPPEVVRTTPASKSVNFKEDKIKITFNEYLKSTGFAQTLISPPLEKKPEYKLEGKTVTVRLKSKLRANTTYTINFAEDIKDLNEGNTLNNFNYVFSTGPYIDSQKIAGNVVLAKDNTPAEGAVVSLYPPDSTNGILNAKPFYFAKTDKSGNFSIENIKAGKYHIYALKDQNYNYFYDQPNELVAFADSVVNLTDSIQPYLNLLLFEEVRGKIQLENLKTISPGHLQLYFSKPISRLQIVGDAFSNDDFTVFNTTRDTINYWYSKYYVPNSVLYITMNDTLIDTMRMELKYIAKDSLAINPQYSLALENQVGTGKMRTQVDEAGPIEDLYKPLKINFNRPIIEMNENKRLSITRDSSSESITHPFTLDEKTKQSISIDLEKIENSTYTVEIPDSAFRDIFGMWNRRIVYKFRTISKDAYGNLRITLKTNAPENHYLVKLIDAAGETVHEILFTGSAEKKTSIDNVPAGSYKFLVIDDRNRNGKWDTGDFQNKIQPEKMFLYKDTYQLKGGWDLDVMINL